MNEQEYIAHYGVLGMKWGRRKNSSGGYTSTKEAKRNEAKKKRKAIDDSPELFDAYQQGVIDSSVASRRTMNKRIKNMESEINKNTKNPEYLSKVDAYKTGIKDGFKNQATLTAITAIAVTAASVASKYLK